MPEEYGSGDDIFNTAASNTDEGNASAPTVNEPGTDLEQPSAGSQTDATGAPVVEGEADASLETPANPDDTPIELSAEQQAIRDEYLKKLIAEEKTPDWFKNAAKNYERRLTEMSTKTSAWSPLEEHGTPEEIQAKLASTKVAEWRDNPTTGYPELSTEKWVNQTYEQDPEIAVQLVKDLAFKPSPLNSGWNLAHEVIASAGLDPTKIPELQEFAQNGYQTKTISSGAYPAPSPEELQNIAPDLRDAYTALSPDERELYLPTAYDSDLQKTAKERLLRSEKARLESTVSDESANIRKEYEAKWNEFQAKQAFDREIFEKSNEYDEVSGDRVLAAFNESLVKQSGMSSFEATEISNTLLTALEGRGSAAKMTMAALEAQGITLDPQITPLLSERQALNKHIAHFSHPKINNTAQRDAAINRLNEVEQKLLLKGRTVIAQIVAARAKARTAGIEGHNQALAAAEQVNGINTNGHQAKIGTNLNGNDDYSTYDPLDIFKS